MTKKEILQELGTARAKHLKWLQRAKLMVNGLPIKESAIPVDPTECPFGEWLYEKGTILYALPNNMGEDMKEIEKLHQQIHDEYLKIYSIYYEGKKGFFAKLFGLHKKVSPGQQAIAEEYLKKIQEISDELQDKLEKMEKRVIALSDEEIEKLK